MRQHCAEATALLSARVRRKCPVSVR